MDYGSYEALIKDLKCENADKLVDLINNIKADCETTASLNEKIRTQDERIRDLQDTNAKLFLRVTKQDDIQPETTKSIDDIIKDDNWRL